MFTIAISFEIKVGNVVKAKFSTISSNEEYKSIIFTSNILNGSSQYYLREFDTRYFLNCKEEYRFFKFVEVYVRTRMFDDKQFKEDMKKAMRKVEKEEEPEYIKIIDGSYWKLSDIDFEILASGIIDAAKQGKIPSKEYTKLYAVYKQLYDLGLVKGLTLEELTSKFLLGFKISLTSEGESVNGEDYEGLESLDESIRGFSEQCRNIVVQVCEELEQERVSNLFKKLIDDIDSFYKEVISDFANVAIFEKYDMDILFDKLNKTSNYDLYNFISILNSRYEDNKQLLKYDKKNLKRLSTVINDKCKEAIPSIKVALLGKLSNSIQEITTTKQKKS